MVRFDAVRAVELRRLGVIAAGFPIIAILATSCLADAGGDAQGDGSSDGADASTTTLSASSSSGPGDSSSEAGDSTGEVEPRTICDGSSDLRLVLRVGGMDDGGGGGSGIVGPTWLYHQIGHNYLYVRGDCRFWVVPFQAWVRVPTHTGVLDPVQAEALSLELGYDRWPAVEGTYSGSGKGAYLVFSDMSSTVRCADSCTSGVVATEEIRGWASHGEARWDDLYAQGEPVAASDPLRVDGFYTELLPDDPLPACTVDWPFSFDPATAGVSPPPYPKNDPGLTRSRAVTDPVVAEDIRAYWDEQTAAYEPGDPCSIESSGGRLRFFAPDDPQAQISMWIRDAVPFENEDGLVPVPIPEQVFPPSR